MKLKIKKLTETAKLPRRSHIGDLYDLFADEDVYIDDKPKQVRTGLAMDIPEGFQVRLYNRSSLGQKGLILANSVGIIDTGYKGEIKALFYSLDGDYVIHKGDKILQMEIVALNEFDIEEVSELSNSERGTGGFGSTGK